MIQANGNTEVGFNMTSPSSGQQRRSWFARHSKDASDASLAEFEQLMAAMGYRQLETTIGNPVSRTASQG